MAEALFRHAVAGREDFQVSSAGVAASKGAAASRETCQVLKKRGVPLTDFQSRPVSEKLLKEASHIFAMTAGHLAALQSRFPNQADKFYLVKEFAGITNNRAGVDVPDPIGMGLAAYEEVARVFDSAIPSIIAYIDAESSKQA